MLYNKCSSIGLGSVWLKKITVRRFAMFVIYEDGNASIPMQLKLQKDCRIKAELDETS